MDYEARKSLCALVEEATTTGEKELQAKHITLLKKFLRQGKDVVECAFDVALKQLRTGHSQVLASFHKFLTVVTRYASWLGIWLCTCSHGAKQFVSWWRLTFKK